MRLFRTPDVTCSASALPTSWVGCAKITTRVGRTRQPGRQPVLPGSPGKGARRAGSMSRRIKQDDRANRLIPPAFTIGVSDGQLRRHYPEMRFSLIGRELVNDAASAHLAANRIRRNDCGRRPATSRRSARWRRSLSTMFLEVILSDRFDQSPALIHGPVVRCLDLVTSFSVRHEPRRTSPRAEVTLHACPGQGDCGGMFTYNTMQTFIGVVGLEPLHMIVCHPRDDHRRLEQFPDRTRRLSRDDDHPRHSPTRM